MKGFYKLLVVLLVLSLLVPQAAVAAETGIPGDATITSATLFVYVPNAIGNTVNVHRLTSDWSETGVTWTNFAGAYDPSVVASFTPTVVGWQSADVTSLVQSWLNGTSPNYGFLLTQTLDASPDEGLVSFPSSEETLVERRPKLEICYDQPVSGNTCITIQRTGSDPVDVVDAYINSASPSRNNGLNPILYTSINLTEQKQSLLRFFFRYLEVQEPSVSIVKKTNGEVASDPNGTDVPIIEPGKVVTWTYHVTNDGNVPVAFSDLSVTDDQPGVTPVFESYDPDTSNTDTVFDPGETWVYIASGIAIDLKAPPMDVITEPNGCSYGGTQVSRTAYINQGTATIPGAEDTAQSSYCNPPRELIEGYKYYLPFVANNNLPIIPDITPFRVTVGYEDLPLVTGQNDYDYNDWVVRIQGSVFLDETNPDLWKRIRLNFEPGGRGAVYTHSFHMNFPANTFSSNGTAVLVTNGPDGNPISTEVIPLVASQNMDITIFSNTGEVFPANFSNTREGYPLVNAQRTAVLTINFDQAIPFDLNDYNFTIPHGTGLFFDPYIRVRNTGDVVRRGDNRLLNVSELDIDYIWPEERVRIDRAYPDLTFNPGPPASITFPDRWWANRNTCVMDGIPCQ